MSDMNWERLADAIESEASQLYADTINGDSGHSATMAAGAAIMTLNALGAAIRSSAGKIDKKF